MVGCSPYKSDQGFSSLEQYNDMEFIYYITYPDGRKERLVHDLPDAVFLPVWDRASIEPMRI